MNNFHHGNFYKNEKYRYDERTNYFGVIAFEVAIF
jgi:hypothetical protein